MDMTEFVERLKEGYKPLIITFGEVEGDDFVEVHMFLTKLSGDEVAAAKKEHSEVEFEDAEEEVEWFNEERGFLFADDCAMWLELD